ncbi:MAG TPA: VOC family protein [Bacilli bacterium]|nr:VOC family protein [Bacilli bacterium]
MAKITGLHHVSAITSSAQKIYDFFIDILGMRLVKKTVNQDDIKTYHLFFADDVGSAGTDMTFFVFEGIPRAKFGTDEIMRTSFRVPSDKALKYFVLRFDAYNVKHDGITTLFGRKFLFFEDFDGQRYALVSDEKVQGIPGGIPVIKSPVPEEYGIVGLGPSFLRVQNELLMDTALVDVLGFRKIETVADKTLYEVGLGGNGAAIIVVKDSESPLSRQGYGSVHHIAFRVDNKEDLLNWIPLLEQVRAPHSGYVDRFYFESLYARLYPQILFEFATDGPGFIDDEESYEVLGEKLALPPFYRDKRSYVERTVRRFQTTRHNEEAIKEDINYLKNLLKDEEI